MTAAQITQIYRYPVKGLSAQSLSHVEIEAGGTMPFDRTFAIENGSRDFDPISPKYFPKIKFLQLMRHEQLAALETEFDDETHMLRILRSGKQVAAGNLKLPVGRQMIEQFLAAYLADAALGALRVVSADNHHFADVPDNFISLINLASVRDLERVLGRPVNPLRFRGNIYVEGWEPWAERKLVGHRLVTASGLEFKVAEEITRCAATNVDPETGQRDMQIPRTLDEVFEHEICGVYLTALTGGTLRSGDTLTDAGPLPARSANGNLGI